MKNPADDVRFVKIRNGIAGSIQNLEPSKIAVATQPTPPIIIGKIVRQLDHGCELPAGMMPSIIAHVEPQNKVFPTQSIREIACAQLDSFLYRRLTKSNRTNRTTPQIGILT